MILLVTAIERRNECAAALQRATGEPVVIADNLLRATTLLRTEVYTAAVFDQSLGENEPHQTDTAVDHLGSAVPVQINLAISGTERLVREVKAAIRLRKHEQATAREVAAHFLYSELNSTLTTLLLNCELALEIAGLPPAAAERLASIHGAAQKLRSQLETSASAARAGGV
ncbi:MAG: hypothetical protein WA172_03850 [Terriglobales bacterium]